MRGTLAATGIIAALALHYAVSCFIRPYRDCWVCSGQAHHRSKSNRRLSRPCRWCRASGKRLRIGRRLYNRAIRTRRAAGVDR